MDNRVFFLLVVISFIIIVINTVEKHKSFERESLYWIIGSILMLILAVKPYLIQSMAKFVNVEYAPSLLFLVAIVFIMYLLFKHSIQVSELREQNKDLAQYIVVLTKKIDEIKSDKIDKEESN